MATSPDSSRSEIAVNLAGRYSAPEGVLDAKEWFGRIADDVLKASGLEARCQALNTALGIVLEDVGDLGEIGERGQAALDALSEVVARGDNS